MLPWPLVPSFGFCWRAFELEDALSQRAEIVAGRDDVGCLGGGGLFAPASIFIVDLQLGLEVT